MKLKTYTASDLPAAMALVRREMGDDAIILNTQSDKTRKSVTVTVALEMPEESAVPNTPPPPLRSVSHLRTPGHSAVSEEWLDDLSYLMRYHSVPDTLAGRIMYRARNLELDKVFALQKSSPNTRSIVEHKALAKLLSDLFRFDPLPLKQPGTRIMLVGASGIGKTLAIAKFATQMAMDHEKFAVITTDTQRAGGIEQLQAFTDILRMPLIIAEDAKQLQDALKGLQSDTRALIDSAGCNPYNNEDLAELTAYVAVGGFEPVLALPAGMDSLEAVDTARAFAFPAIKRLLVTRADSARRFGAILAAADAAKLAFANIADSSRIAGELKVLEPAGLAQRMLQYRTDNR